MKHVGQISRLLHATISQRNAGIQTTQTRSVPQTKLTQQLRRGIVFDVERNVIQQRPRFRRQRVYHLFQNAVEIVSCLFVHDGGSLRQGQLDSA